MALNVDLSNFAPLQRNRSEYYNRLALNLLNGQKSNKKEKVLKDEFIRSEETLTKQDSFIDITTPYISEELLLDMNSACKCVVYDDVYVEYNGYRFLKSQIPDVDTSKLETVTAKNNVMDFGKDKYFKYITTGGKEVNMISRAHSIGTLSSESVKYDSISKEAARYASFWDYMMSEDPVYMGLSFSKEEIKEYLSEADIEPGFVTIKIGDEVATQYYSQTKTLGMIQSKERYDIKYNALTTGTSGLTEFAPGSIVKVGGVEYTIDENHHINIPYGADIYDMEYPRKQW